MLEDQNQDGKGEKDWACDLIFLGPMWTNNRIGGSRCKGREAKIGILTINHQCHSNGPTTDKVW